MQISTRLPAIVICLGALSLPILTAGCTSRPYASPQEAAMNACRAFGPKAMSGALIGGLGGAAGGAAIGAAAGGGRGAAIGAGIGLLAGLMAGTATGNQLDQRDCAAAQIALAQVALQPQDTPILWVSPSGSRGSFTPLAPEQQMADGTFCRPTRQATNIAGREPVQTDVLTCRAADGSAYVRGG